MSARFVCTPLPLHGLVRVQRQPLQDARGLFERMFCADELAAAGWTQPIAQINHSVTRQRGSVRGLHYQRPPHAEMKLVSCLRGEVWDVAVDLRAGSPTFLQWHAERLSPGGMSSAQALLGDRRSACHCKKVGEPARCSSRPALRMAFRL